MPKIYRRTFDFLTCAEALGTSLLPASCFTDMLATLKPGGYCIFTVSQKHLISDTSFDMGYTAAIQKLIDQGHWRPVIHRKFMKYHGFAHGVAS